MISNTAQKSRLQMVQLVDAEAILLSYLVCSMQQLEGHDASEQAQCCQLLTGSQCFHHPAKHFKLASQGCFHWSRLILLHELLRGVQADVVCLPFGTHDGCLLSAWEITLRLSFLGYSQTKE